MRKVSWLCAHPMGSYLEGRATQIQTIQMSEYDLEVPIL